MFPPLLKGLYLLLPLAYIHIKIFHIPVQSIIWMKIFFFGIDAKDLLVKMLKSPNCIDGCKLVAVRPQTNPSHFRKGTWTFVCSHGIVMNDIDESHFHPDYVGKSNVPIQRLKRTKSRGSAGNALLEFWLRCEYVSGVVAWNNNHQTRGEGLLWAEKRLVLKWWLNN